MEIKEAHISSIVLSQLLSGMFRQVAIYVGNLISDSSSSKCNTEVGLHLKMQVTSLLDLLSEDSALSSFANGIKYV